MDKFILRPETIKTVLSFLEDYCESQFKKNAIVNGYSGDMFNDNLKFRQQRHKHLQML